MFGWTLRVQLPKTNLWRYMPQNNSILLIQYSIQHSRGKIALEINSGNYVHYRTDLNCRIAHLLHEKLTSQGLPSSLRSLSPLVAADRFQYVPDLYVGTWILPGARATLSVDGKEAAWLAE